MSGMTQEFITSVQLQSYFVDKTTGVPLSGGYVEFFKDSDRVTGKDVYQKQQNGFDISGNPLYEYVSLGNVVQLSGVGTFMDNDNNDIAVYYYPWDADGNLELYYVAVFSADGTPQLTREGWPDSFATDNPDIADSGGFENQISNPQFALVNFDPSATFTIGLSGNSTTTIEIAPDWDLVVTHTATTTIAVARTAIAGSSNFPTQAPFYLTITPGSNINSVKLVQQLTNNPGIWSAISAGTGGYVASSITLGASTPSTTIVYTPSTGTAIPLLTAVNASSDYVEYKSTVQLAPSNNTATATTGYVNIVINLSAVSASTLSSVQVVGMNGDFQDVDYEQTTVNRQIDHLFNYYNPLLQYKPMPSYLVGWDFPLNPAQFLGASIAAQAVGANKSYYAWDETILFQSADSGITVSRDTTGALKTLSAPVAGTQLALVQYLPAPQAIEMLSRRKCVNVSANASVATVATVSLWYTKTTLPSTIGSNNSIVLTLDANGYPATQNGTWVQVPRSGLGYSTTTTTATNAAKITIGTAPSGAASFNQYPLSGWDMQGDTDINGATYFAIVVGTASLAQNAYISWQSISCQDGDIATVPAPQSANAVLADCQAYYEKSFNVGVVPAQNVGVNSGEFLAAETQSGPAANNLVGTVFYKVAKNKTPSTITTYNPAAANAQVRNETSTSDCSATAILNNNLNSFAISCSVGGGMAIGDKLGVHWASDARSAQ